ncbi:MAG: hypothetical protein ACRDGR_00505, partial [bacterium]
EHTAAGAPNLHAGLREEIVRRNRTLPEFKRVRGVIVWEADFPRTASLKVRRAELGRAIAESEHAVIDLS